MFAFTTRPDNDHGNSFDPVAEKKIMVQERYHFGHPKTIANPSPSSVQFSVFSFQWIGPCPSGHGKQNECKKTFIRTEEYGILERCHSIIEFESTPLPRNREGIKPVDPSLQQELISLLPRFRRFARGLTGNDSDADDLVQSAIEKALNRLDSWTDGTRLDSWIYRIIQTTWIDEYRRRAVRANYLETVSLEGNLHQDGERDMENTMTLGAVRRALQSLPDEQRVVLLLICIEGYSYKEAADTLGIPIGTLTSRLARGRLALDRLIYPTNTQERVANSKGGIE